MIIDLGVLSSGIETILEEYRKTTAYCVYRPHFSPNQTDDWTSVMLKSAGGDVRKQEVLSHYPECDSYEWTNPAREYCPETIKIVEGIAGEHIGVRRVRYSRVTAYGKINPHADEGYNTQGVVMRLHVPILTHRYCVTSVGEDRQHLGRGRLYYCDFSLEHSVENNSDRMRVHLLIDLAAGDVRNAIQMGVADHLRPCFLEG